jgi:SAM-dependent methyltransferase
MSGWQAFWGGSHRIYVNDRHLAAHYAQIADDLIALFPGPTSAGRGVLLDWGCGDALASPRLAAAGFAVTLYDAVPAVQARVAQRFASASGITVLDDAAYAALPAHNVDVLLVNSVLQYLPRDALATLLPRFRALLKPDGVLLLADVIPPDAGMLDDIRALIASASRHGYLLAALRGLVATFFSPYRKLRSDLGLTTWSESDMVNKLKACGFAAERLPRNIGFSPHRMLFRAVPTQ